MTPPRITVPGAVTAITKRCVMRKAFLGPWHPLVSQIWLYSMGLAQAKTDVAIHYGIRVVNHHHLDVTPRANNLPDFTRNFHSELSKGICALLTREGYDAPQGIFDKREPHYMRLLDAEAQLSHLLYQHLNCVAAGLVQRPEHMPDVLLHPSLWRKGYLEVERPPVYHDSERKPDGIRILLTPDAFLYETYGGDIDRMVYYFDRLTEDGIRALRVARRGKPVKGVKAVQRIHPWSEPATLRERGGQPKPSFRIGARGIVGKQANIEAALETRAHRDRYTDVRLVRKDGIDVPYPYGTYAQVVIHAQPMEPEPTLGNLVTQPGRLLEDVQAELGQSPITLVERRALSLPFIDEVRSALVDEAVDLIADAEVDFATQVGIHPTEAPPNRPAKQEESGNAKPGDAKAGDAKQRTGIVVRRRRSKRRKQHEHAARRVVILRDRRLGRPPTDSGRSGSDPPS